MPTTKNKNKKVETVRKIIEEIRSNPKDAGKILDKYKEETSGGENDTI